MVKYVFRFLIFLLIHAGIVWAAGAQQITGVPDAEFGEIPDSLFSIESSADDIPYLFTNRELEITFEEGDQSIVAVLDYHVRLRIFDKEARQASIVALPYYYNNGMERISNIRGTTYLSSGEKIELNPERIRTINLNSRYNVKEFTMPGIEDGSVVEYAYRIRRRYIEELPDFYLSREAPTSIAKVKITYPEYLRYEAYTENYDGNINNSTARVDTGTVPKIFTVPQPEPIVMEEWSATDIPKVDEISYISSVNDYRGKLKFQLSEFGIPRQQLENNWNLVVARLRRNQNPLDIAELNDEAKKIGRSIANEIGEEYPEAVQDSVFKYVNSRMNYSGMRTPFSTIRDGAVLKGKTADQAAVAQTLLAMLQGAGINAFPLLVSTRETGRINLDFPSFYQFNSQIVCTEIGDKMYFLDAAFPHSQPDLIPVETYNETGLLLKEDSFEWIDINPEKSIFDIAVTIKGSLTAGGNLSGTVTAEYTGYPAQIIRTNRAQGEHESSILRETLFDGFSKITFSNTELQNIDDFDKPVEVRSDFTVEDYAISFTDGLRFNPMIVGQLMNNPFDENNRELPVTLDAPEKLEVRYDITLPSGFSVNRGSNNRSISLPGANFNESYNMNSQRMQYSYQINIGRKNFSTNLFPQLYNLYERWVELSNTAWLLETN